MGRWAAVRRLRPPDVLIETLRDGGDAQIRRMIWPSTGEPRGTVLFVGGRADFFEKYMESLAHWHSQGWTVTSFDWPGQGGSGRRLSSNLGHSDGYEDWIATLGRYWHKDVKALPGPHVIIGHSMGGHLAARAMSEGVIDPVAAVLLSPMFGLLAHVPRPVAHFVSNSLARAGMRQRGGPMSSRTELEVGRQAILTADRMRYADEDFWLTKDPDLRTGPPSWGWIAASYRSLKKMRRTRALARITSPVLVLYSGQDALVDPVDTARAIVRMPHAIGHRYEANAAHELLRETDAVRDDVLARIDAFFDAQAPRI